jgi:Ca2+-binding RTX toxin-like protein
VSFITADDNGFTINAVDVDSEPNWSALRLVTAVNGVNAVNDNTDTTFAVESQALSVATNLSVTDGTNSTQVLVSGRLGTVVQGTADNDTFSAVTGFGIYYGFDGDDTISGSAGNDFIFGGDGNDFIRGNAGSDSITLGAGSDTLLFNNLSGTDTVADYTPSDDLIQLAKSVFTGLTTASGALSSAEFESGAGLTSASTAAGRVVYNSTSGALYYDADGAGGNAAVQIATLTGTPVLNNNEFFIV